MINIQLSRNSRVKSRASHHLSTVYYPPREDRVSEIVARASFHSVSSSSTILPRVDIPQSKSSARSINTRIVTTTTKVIQRTKLPIEERSSDSIRTTSERDRHASITTTSHSVSQKLSTKVKNIPVITQIKSHPKKATPPSHRTQRRLNGTNGRVVINGHKTHKAQVVAHTPKTTTTRSSNVHLSRPDNFQSSSNTGHHSSSEALSVANTGISSHKTTTTPDIATQQQSSTPTLTTLLISTNQNHHIEVPTVYVSNSPKTISIATSTSFSTTTQSHTSHARATFYHNLSSPQPSSQHTHSTPHSHGLPSTALLGIILGSFAGLLLLSLLLFLLLLRRDTLRRRRLAAANRPPTLSMPNLGRAFRVSLADLPSHHHPPAPPNSAVATTPLLSAPEIRERERTRNFSHPTINIIPPSDGPGGLPAPVRPPLSSHASYTSSTYSARYSLDSQGNRRKSDPFDLEDAAT